MRLFTFWITRNDTNLALEQIFKIFMASNVEYRIGFWQSRTRQIKEANQAVSQWNKTRLRSFAGGDATVRRSDAEVRF